MRPSGRRGSGSSSVASSDSSGAGSGGPGGRDGFASREEYVEFHNAHDTPQQRVLCVDLRSLPPEVLVEIRLSRLRTRRPLSESISGSIGSRTPSPAERIIVPPSDLPAHLAGPAVSAAVDVIPVEPTIYTIAPAARLVVDGVELPAYGACAARFTVRIVGDLPAGAEYRFEVQQLDAKAQKVLGGSTYVVRVAGGSDRMLQLRNEEPPGWPENRVAKRSYAVQPWLRRHREPEPSGDR